MERYLQLTKATDKKYKLQCKILHKVYASNSYVSIFDLTVAENCETCTFKHNTKHFFVDCRKVTFFWKQFKVFLAPEKDDITCNDILFGNLEDDSFALNYCLLHAKWYLHREHKGSKMFKNYAPSFQRFILYLRNELRIEKCCYELRVKADMFTEFLGTIFELVQEYPVTSENYEY